MKLKERIKSKVDQLDPSELRIVGALIDTLKERRNAALKDAYVEKDPYLKVIEMMGTNFLTSHDILADRQERI
jgi:hypothetical protein